jgi:hypothetical protein
VFKKIPEGRRMHQFPFAGFAYQALIGYSFSRLVLSGAEH